MKYFYRRRGPAREEAMRAGTRRSLHRRVVPVPWQASASVEATVIG
ncbi:hypothetical protein [Sorangium sp. So ce426]